MLTLNKKQTAEISGAGLYEDRQEIIDLMNYIKWRNENENEGPYSEDITEFGG